MHVYSSVNEVNGAGKGEHNFLMWTKVEYRTVQ
jgi:hypothetical protein